MGRTDADGRGSVGDIENGTGGRARYARLSSLSKLTPPSHLPSRCATASAPSGVVSQLRQDKFEFSRRFQSEW